MWVGVGRVLRKLMTSRRGLREAAPGTSGSELRGRLKVSALSPAVRE